MSAEHHLVLGGSGFIGQSVVTFLVAKGYRVTVVDRSPFPEGIGLAAGGLVRSLVLDLSAVDWSVLLEDIDVVHHYFWASTPASANADPKQDLNVNVGASIDLLEALRRRGGGRLVFSSSGGTVYGRAPQTPIDEDHSISPITAYGAGKAAAELYLKFYREMYGLDCRIARIANPFGSNQRLVSGVGAVTSFMRRALAHEPIVIWGDGSIIRDYIYIDDVAECLIRLATSELKSDKFIFNIGTGVGQSLNDVVLELERHFGRSLNVTRTEQRSFDVPVNVLSIERAKQVLGWKPAFSFSEGVENTLCKIMSQHAG
jgi:UDP-glucose 4-epimerase